MTEMSGSHSKTRSRTNYLARIPVSELKAIRVAVRRTHITCSGPATVIERSIDDPKSIIPIVHYRKDGERTSKSIFDREDVVVNDEERLVLADANQLEDTRDSRSCSRSRSRSKRRSRSRSSSPSRSGRDKDRSGRDKDRRSPLRRISPDKKNDGRVSVDRGKGRPKGKSRSLEREKDGRSYRNRAVSRERDNAYRKRSRTPSRASERPSCSDQKRRSMSREREFNKIRSRSRRRSRSPSKDRYRPSTSFRKSASPCGYGKSAPSRRSSRSPRRYYTPDRDVRAKASRYGESKERRSRSPGETSKPYYADRSRRERSVEKRRRSRSPTSRYERDRRRSRSPLHSPTKYSRRNSRSPGRHDGHRAPPDKRTRSSRSPNQPSTSFHHSRSEYGRSSRSREYDRDRRYRGSEKERGKSRSRSPSNRTSHRDREAEFGFYEGIPGAEYWIPGPIRPGFPGLPRFYPPPLYPRGMVAPIILPPRMPLVYPPYRQRLPIYNSRQKPKTSTPSTSTVTITEPVASTSTGASSGGEDTVTIQEIINTVRVESSGNEQLGKDNDPKDNLHERD